MSSDRRQAVRIPLVIKVTVQATEESHFYFSKDISAGGMFLETKEAFPMGSTVNLDFSVPVEEEQVKITATGEVARLVSYEEAQREGLTPGMGIRFRALPEEVSTALGNFIDDLLTARGSG